jgi:PAS domain S-box-containing protein
MRTTSKLILANSLIALLVVLIFASFSLNSFYEQDQHEEHKNLERSLRTLREFLAPGGEHFRLLGGQLLVGDRVLNGDCRPVDQVQGIFGGVATVFMGELRVATNVPDDRGKRALGTRLSGPAYQAVFQEGRPYRGEAVIFGHPYLTAYDPIRDRSGRVIGALFVGVQTSSLLEEFRHFKSATTVMLALVLASLLVATMLLLRFTFDSKEANHLKLLKTLMNTIPNPIYYKDAKGCYLGFNKACEQFFGMDLNKFIGKTAYDLWPRDMADRYTARDRDLLANPGTQMYEEDAIFANGTRHDVIFNKASFDSQDGAVAGMVGVILDITERKAVEEQTRNTNQRLLDIIEFLPDPTFVVDSERRVIAWNKAIEKMTGLKKEDIVGQGDYAYALPFYGERRPVLIDLIDDDPDMVYPDYPFLKREGTNLFCQTFVPGREGRESRYIWATAAALFDEHGKSVGGIESMRDVTDYKRVENELRLKNLLQSTQLESSIDGILAVDARERVVSYNRRLLEIFGISQQMADAGDDESLLRVAMERAEDPQAFLEAVHLIYRQPQDTSRDEVELKGGVIIDRYSAPMVDSDGSYYGRVWYFRDISEQKHAEEVRRRLEAQRHHSQMMESFITQLGHDLRTPLTPLFALLPLIREKVADPKLQTMIDICNQSALTVHELTEKALKLVRLSTSTTGLLQTVCLAEKVDDYIVENAAHFECNEVRCDNGIDRDIQVVVVPEQLRELFGNLMSNAARHSFRGGIVRLKARLAGDSVTVSVQDEGVGVDPADLEHIFDEFFKVDESRHDLASPGLGLAICRRIVANHQGTIWAESNGKGCGTTVSFTLPLH